MTDTVMVLGASGMMGGAIVRLGLPGRLVLGVVRGAPADGQVGGVDVTDRRRMIALLEEHRPYAVINCVGIIRQRAEAQDPLTVIPVNSLFPHQLHVMCRERGIRLLHISTDCVFSGRSGPSNEDSPTDPVDLYGRSKLLGELDGPGALTLRTSIVGREAGRGLGLVEWFLSQPPGSTVRGFTRALYTGVSTQTAARVMSLLLDEKEPREGLWHLAGPEISKYELLVKLRERFGRNVNVVSDDSVAHDRRLDGKRLANALGIRIPDWSEMIDEIWTDSKKLKGNE